MDDRTMVARAIRGGGWSELTAGQRLPYMRAATRVLAAIEQEKRMNQPAPQAGGGLVALIGTAAATILIATVTLWEGTETVPYKDVVGVWTVCTGDTKDVVPGKVYTKAECEERLERQLIAHAKPVLQCVPKIKDRPEVLAASASLSYNIGPAAFCRSTVARRFNAGDWKGGCDAFLAWRFAGGREIRGLLNRRNAEREICLRGI